MAFPTLWLYWFGTGYGDRGRREDVALVRNSIGVGVSPRHVTIVQHLGRNMVQWTVRAGTISKPMTTTTVTTTKFFTVVSGYNPVRQVRFSEAWRSGMWRRMVWASLPCTVFGWNAKCSAEEGLQATHICWKKRCSSRKVQEQVVWRCN